MAPKESENPFWSGPGLVPPHLAGRLDELFEVKSTLDVIKDRSGQMDRSPYPILALVGPRGAGKTVLLEHAVLEAKRRGIHIGEVTREKLIGPQVELVRQLFPANEAVYILERLKDRGRSVFGVGASIGPYGTRAVLRAAMLDFLARQPMLLVLDEAHHCEPEGLGKLLGVVQCCIQSRLPLALIITGTPGLSLHLRSCEVDFVDNFMCFNTLTHEESKAALEVPARITGRPMEAEALKCMIDWSDNYRFFIQMAGRHAWNASAARGGKDIAIDDAKAGLAKADLFRNDFYNARYDEIFDLKVNNMKVVDQAVQIADLVATDESQFDRGSLATRLAEINNDMDEDHAVGIIDALLEIGYLWRYQGVIEPGIPFLFDFVKRKRTLASA